MSRSTNPRNITRIEDGPKNQAGWYVRVQFMGRKLSRLFPDRRHGDKLGALANAIRWRDEAERRLGRPQAGRRVVALSRSPLGICGVTRRRYSFVVTWTPRPGETKSEFFSIARYGEDGAFDRAVRRRRQREREMYGRSLV